MDFFDDFYGKSILFLILKALLLICNREHYHNSTRKAITITSIHMSVYYYTLPPYINVFAIEPIENITV